MKLLYYPHEFLNREMKTVDLENPSFDPTKLKKDMIDFMLENNGIGLAANQVGIDAKVFVFGDSNNNATMCINPTVLQYTSETQTEIEGCLSFPNTYVKIKRPKEILAQFWNENLEECVVKITGYSAAVYLHEMDHTLGITIKDRVSNLKWDIATRKAQKLEKNHA